MKNIYNNLQKILQSLSYPFIFICTIIVFINILNLINNSYFNDIYNYFTKNYTLLFAMLFPSFISFAYCDNSKKAIITSFSIIICDMVLYSISKVHISLLLIVLLSILFSNVFKKFDLLYGFIILILSSLTLGFILGLVNPYFNNLFEFLCKTVGNKGSVFGVISNIYNLLFGDKFEKSFYLKSYGGVRFINKTIVSGAKNIFENNIDNPYNVVSTYLTGNYFVSIFATIGIFFALYKRFQSINQYAFVFVCATSILTGDIKIISLYLLLFSPLIYLGYLFIIFISYLVSNLIDIRIGFLQTGTIIELFKYQNKIIYFIICGIIISILTYFMINFIFVKINIKAKKNLPDDVKTIVDNLGGEKNIVSIKDTINVKNPNIINELNIECEINENQIKVDKAILDKLNQYF